MTDEFKPYSIPGPITIEIVRLGCVYSDSVTGFDGVAVGVVRYLTGCAQVLLQPTMPPGASAMPESHWFDVSRLQFTGKSSWVQVEPVERVGDLGDPGPDKPAPKI